MTDSLQYLVRLVDVPLGWLLFLPRDVSLLLFALGTALLMTLVRRVVTNQDLLHRCVADQQRLKHLIREARRAGDPPALARLRQTSGQVKGIQLVADMRVLGAVVIPVAILAIWASERFDYLPPRIGDDLILRAEFPASSIDTLTHLVPPSHLHLKSSAIQVVKSDGRTPPAGNAEWTLQPTKAGDLTLTIRHQAESVIHPVTVGRSTYHAPVWQHASLRLPRTMIELRQYRPLGSDLGSRWTGLPPWMIGYLILTLVLVPLLKRRLGVA